MARNQELLQRLPLTPSWWLKCQPLWEITLFWFPKLISPPPKPPLDITSHVPSKPYLSLLYILIFFVHRTDGTFHTYRYLLLSEFSPPVCLPRWMTNIFLHKVYCIYYKSTLLNMPDTLVKMLKVHSIVSKRTCLTWLSTFPLFKPVIIIFPTF